MRSTRASLRRQTVIWVSLALLSMCSACTKIADRDCNRSPDFCPAGYECRQGRCVSLATEEGGWIRIEAGSFRRGSPEEEIGRTTQGAENPHQVTLTQPFMIQAREVTRSQFAEVMGLDIGDLSFPDCGSDCPAVGVSWNEAAEYTNRLSQGEGLPTCYECAQGGDCTLKGEFESPYQCPGYRLPTDAEWEYAARADSTAATPAGEISAGACADCCEHEPTIDAIAWYCWNADYTGTDAFECRGRERCGPQPVGTKDANAWGLYDMLGNAAEWVGEYYLSYQNDQETDPHYLDPQNPRGGATVLRGGSFLDPPEKIRSAFRMGETETRVDIGFRPARTALD